VVYLVGAGPGDPDLVTVKGLKAIQSADVILYDRLAAPELLQHARPDATLIHVGKAPGNHLLTQEAINEALVDLGKQGLTVCRLKGGDPFVFGRGGEEAAALVAGGVPFQVIPGISSAIAVPGAAGIPVTHRNTSRSFTVITGTALDVDWGAAARLGGTLVILMGLATLPTITAKLTEGGLDPQTPAAIIERGTTPQQRTVTGPLVDLPALAEREGIESPAIVVIGAVVGLRELLADGTFVSIGG
jgi:uroporphyrin-III C-methyltransferase